MRIFLYEHLTGGGMLGRVGRALDGGSLLVEGLVMLRAVATDLAGVAGVELIVQLDRRISARDLPGCALEWVGSPGEVETSFQQLAGAADLTLVIAPEFDRILLRRCQSVEDLGGRLLGPSSQIVALFSDKFALAQQLARAGVPVPEMRLLEHVNTAALRSILPAVVKPRYGAGSQDMFLVTTPEDLRPISRAGNVIESFCPGLPASTAVLCGPRTSELLPAVAQRLSDDGHFRYLGGRLPIPPYLQQRAHRLVRRGLAVLPPLHGFLGFDLVLGDETDGSRDFIIEVNPRLTTSYVCLRAACRQNLAQVMIDVALGRPFEVSFSDKPIEFCPDGSVT